MKQLKILVIDDEKLIRWSFEKQLNNKASKVFTAESGEAGIQLFQQHYPDIVFLDNKLPNMQGLEVIPRIRSIDEEAIIVFMTAYGSIDTAVEAIKRGAYEYLNKPFNFKEINVILDNIKNKIKINKEIHLLRLQNKEDITFDFIVGKSKKILQIKQMSKKIARSESSTVLLLGESGTGKDLFAKAIHNESSRNDKPFVIINCSSFPDTLLESELFGHEKGAFTDAKKMKKGLFEIAEGGTVFLDEIGEISLATQVKLLGVLENRTVRRLGSTIDIPVEIRVIAATNKDLKRSIEDKTFREDLFYRLQVFQVVLPPLREHSEDIPELIKHFINLFNAQFRKKVASIDSEAEKILTKYSWPGNTRELRNVMERAIILESGAKLNIEHFPYEIIGHESDHDNLRASDSSQSHPYNCEIPEEGISLDEMEKRMIIKALEKADNNQTKAANLLGISRDALRYKKKKYNL